VQLAQEDGGTTLLRNFRLYFVTDAASHPTRLDFPSTPLWESPVLLRDKGFVCEY